MSQHYDHSYGTLSGTSSGGPKACLGHHVTAHLLKWHATWCWPAGDVMCPHHGWLCCSSRKELSLSSENFKLAFAWQLAFVCHAYNDCDARSAHHASSASQCFIPWFFSFLIYQSNLVPLEMNLIAIRKMGWNVSISFALLPCSILLFALDALSRAVLVTPKKQLSCRYSY